MMRKFLAFALTLIFAFYISVSYAAPIRIEQDFGGSVDDYATVAFVLSVTGQSLAIDGPCISACLLYLNKDFSIPICVTKNAIIGFHYPYVEDVKITKRVLRDTLKIGNYILNGLPDVVQSHLRTQHLPNHMLGDPIDELAIADYSILSKAYPTCSKV